LLTQHNLCIAAQRVLAQDGLPSAAHRLLPSSTIMTTLHGPDYRSNAGPSRPASIQELASRAHKFTDNWDPSKELKYWLRVAEHARHLAQSYDRDNDIENAFVEYAKAATLILQKIPQHREFSQRLDSTQRETLSIVRARTLVFLIVSTNAESTIRKAKAFSIGWES
jgi:hypothetical protein